ncbi:hypothetical protein SAMN05421690_10673 [Nitrosomonas sp. Nm51]|uniref:arginine N-succinyltransferase n=1 Tax=Nitrosomonas sp. Nm51 TaxID=133720 RepID=UPI0008C25BCB|nr:arginine N-succinyltransferase [Nitrosomonas sp. Nm51]SER75502.1 hypothetical protein SAMN05421690_10673 [Nitrosomonas sp. Nm51]
MNWTHVLLIVFITMVITIVGTYWVLKTHVFASAFIPVSLSTKEKQTLEAKLDKLGYGYTQGTQSPSYHQEYTYQSQDDAYYEDGFLQPEPYTEAGASREISFTERELNALLAKNTDLARKLAIDLDEGLVSAKLLVPLAEEFPVLGGKTLRFNAGVGMAYRNGKPVIVLNGISMMGAPIPNAWLGGLKNIDLVSEFGADPGFWQSFSEGIEHIQVSNGRITIKLRE